MNPSKAIRGFSWSGYLILYYDGNQNRNTLILLIHIEQLASIGRKRRSSSLIILNNSQRSIRYYREYWITNRTVTGLRIDHSQRNNIAAQTLFSMLVVIVVCCLLLLLLLLAGAVVRMIVCLWGEEGENDDLYFGSGRVFPATIKRIKLVVLTSRNGKESKS